MKNSMKFMKIEQKNNPGFTLIETLIVLFLVCSFVLLPTLTLQRWQQQLEKRYFYYQLEKSILHLQQVAITDHQNTQIRLFQDDQQMLVFFTTQTEFPWKILNVPESIKLVSGYSISFSAGKGNISTTQPGNGSIPKIIFNEQERQPNQVIYQFQLGSGRFERK
ncbi:competence type IV pilus minor pilin ComGD [Enterococcus hailinensis]|uniref:competence type IV pilus minor pilin ComGD n=1 Tax=Enterococcus hailinensis TaxID=3238988 RepID=UPI0038B34778